ncbi:MAG: response regulator transcription factor [Mogibacterium sp.]|nr:response regulator transcription factor [Mogibacterium sp.]MBQ6315181.1 response regulator transcription factor [Mogibacterium sp.]
MALVYIVEDDPGIREVEEMALRNSNYTVQTFGRAADLYAALEAGRPDLLLLDVMLPDEDGYSILRRIRKDSKLKDLPVIMITARNTEMDLIKGFDYGADDYVMKPFSVMELLSRIRALLRRTMNDEAQIINVGDICLDHDRHTVTAAGTPVELTFKEYELLRYMMINLNIVLTRESIMQNVWGTDFEGESRTVDMHIKTLRRKLGESGRYIRTVRNVGYVIDGTERE